MPNRFSTTYPKNHFPIVAQLGVILFLLSAIFVTVLFTGKTDAPAIQTVETLPQPASPTDMTLGATLERINITAKAAYVYDVTNEHVLYSKNANEALPLASITKLMTALLTEELSQKEAIATVPLSAALQESSQGLQPGERLSYSQLTEMALVSSSNDAAHSLAVNIGGELGDADAVAQFITAMNIRAEELGLNSLKFYNATGLDLSLSEAGAYGSAADVSLLLAYITQRYPALVAPTNQTDARIYNAVGDYRDVHNTNDIVGTIPRLLGSKTGYTDLAGGNLTVIFDAGYNRPIVITVLGATRDSRFNDVASLVDATITTVSALE